MKDRSLVAFTLLAQAAVGGFGVLGAVHFQVVRTVGPQTARLQTRWGFTAVVALIGLAMAASLLHLGSPLLAWRALWNVRRSWLSREILATVLFGAVSAAWAGHLWAGLGAPWVQPLLYGLGAGLGAILLLCTAWAYRLRTVPVWNTVATPAAFVTAALLLGGTVTWAVLEIIRGAAPLWLPLATIGLLSCEFLLLPLWLSALAGGSGAAVRALRQIIGVQRRLLQSRLVLMVVGVALAGLTLLPGIQHLLATALLFLALWAEEALGRALFFAAYVREGP